MRQQFMRGGIYSADSRDVVFRRHRTPLYAGLHHCTGTVPAAHTSRNFRRCGNTSRQQFMRGGIYSADSRDAVFRRHRTPLYAGLHHCTGTVPAAHNSRDFRRCGNTSCGAVRRNPDTAPSSHNLATPPAAAKPACTGILSFKKIKKRCSNTAMCATLGCLNTT